MISKSKKKIAIALAGISLLVVSCLITSCSNKELKEELNNAKTIIEKVDVKDYMKDEQKEVKNLKEKTEKELEKVKDKKEVETILKNFTKELNKIPTKKEYIKNLKANLEKNISVLNAEEKKKAEEIIKSYEKDLNKVNSVEDINSVSKNLSEKITKETGKKVGATSIKAETKQPISSKKTVASNTTSTTNKANSVVSTNPQKEVNNISVKEEPKEVAVTPLKKKSGHYEKKLVKDAWTEEIPQQYIEFFDGNEVYESVCIEGYTEEMFEDLITNKLTQYECNYRSIRKNKTVNHQAIYEDVWVED